MVQAAPKAVFSALTRPEMVQEWLFRTPNGVLQQAECVPVIGGRLLVSELRDGVLAAHCGEFTYLEPDRKLSFDFWVNDDESTRTSVTVLLDGASDQCLVVLVHDGLPEDAADQAAAGWNDVLDSLQIVISR